MSLASDNYAELLFSNTAWPFNFMTRQGQRWLKVKSATTTEPHMSG